MQFLSVIKYGLFLGGRPFARVSPRRRSLFQAGRLFQEHEYHSSSVFFQQEKNIVRSKYAPVPLSEQNFFDYIWTNVENNADRPALVSCHLNTNSLPIQIAFFLNCRLMG